MSGVTDGSRNATESFYYKAPWEALAVLPQGSSPHTVAPVLGSGSDLLRFMGNQSTGNGNHPRV